MPDIDTFQPEKRTLGQILSSTSPPIRVPDFQRDYSWETEQITEFWSDLIAFGGNEPADKLLGKEYFLGAAVLVDNGTFHLLLDGQQRLATATILLAALRDKMSEFKADAARQVHDQFILFEDHITGERIPRIELNVFDRPFFRDYIQAFPKVSGTEPSKKSHELIRKAYEYFQERIAEGWNSAGAGKEGFKWTAHITLVLREHMALVTVVSNNEKSAASVFATLNDRGIGLSTADLIRSLVLQRASESQREEIFQCWDAALEACGTATAIEGLIRMSWVAQHGDIKTRALYKVVSDLLDKTVSALEYSRRLRADAVLFQSFRDGDTDDLELRDYWVAIRTLKANSGYALLLAAHHCLTPEEQRHIAQALVALAIRHNIVCELDRAKFETTVYAAAKKISDECGFIVALESLRAISPADERFKEGFANLSFSSSEHGVARYLLRAFEAHRQTTEEVTVSGSSKVHVEHIYPKSPHASYRWDDHNKYVNRLGNLTLLDRHLNESIKNGDFAAKKEQAYKLSHLGITKELLKYPDEWSPALVVARQRALSVIGQDIWPATLI